MGRRRSGRRAVGRRATQPPPGAAGAAAGRTARREHPGSVLGRGRGQGGVPAAVARGCRLERHPGGAPGAQPPAHGGRAGGAVPAGHDRAGLQRPRHPGAGAAELRGPARDVPACHLRRQRGSGAAGRAQRVDVGARGQEQRRHARRAAGEHALDRGLRAAGRTRCRAATEHATGPCGRPRERPAGTAGEGARPGPCGGLPAALPGTTACCPKAASSGRR